MGERTGFSRNSLLLVENLSRNVDTKQRFRRLSVLLYAPRGGGTQQGLDPGTNFQPAAR